MSCQSETTEYKEPDGPTNVTILFLDKSSSIKSTVSGESIELTLSEQLQSLRSVIRERLAKTNDRFIGYFLHENTLGASSFVNQTIEAEFPKLKGLGGQTVKNLVAEYEQQINRQAGLVWRDVQEAYSEENQYGSRKYTDVWGSIELISRMANNASTGTDIEVYFLSDMVESMQGDGRRDLHRTPIRDKAEAERFARADAAWIQANQSVDPASLAAVKITVRFPEATLESGDQEFIRYYWEALFQELGVNQVDFF
jgi:hypothetical protein